MMKIECAHTRHKNEEDDCSENQKKENACKHIIFAKMTDLEGAEFESREIRFHTPGEHTFDDLYFELEVQIMFNAVSEQDFRKKAALSFVIK